MAAKVIPTLVETCRFLSDPRLNGRSPSSSGHEEAKVYLLDMLDRLRARPIFGESMIQPVWDGDEVIGENLGGLVPGKSDRYILLGAHYDHFEGIPGADDNAAAVSIIIDTCRQLLPWEGEHHLVLCFFDLEEPPYFHSPRMGSVQFVERCPIPLDQITCTIILDLCGHDVPVPGSEDAMFVLGAEHSPDLVELIRGLERGPIPTFMFRNDRIGDMSDHHAFRLNDVPFLFFSCGWWEHYHQPTDVFENLNLDKMQRFANYLVGLVRALDGRDVHLDPIKQFWKEEARALGRLTQLPVSPSRALVDETLAMLLGKLTM